MGFRNKSIFLAVLVLFLGGCATGYQQQGLTGGYTDMKIQDDIFKVGFSGNSYCGSARAEDFTLLRSAEVALENGYKYFVILDEKSGTITEAYTTPVTSQTTTQTHGSVRGAAYSNMYVGSYDGTTAGTTNYSGGDTYIFRRPSTRNTIKCFKEKPEGISGMIYDAEQIKANMRKQYRIK